MHLVEVSIQLTIILIHNLVSTLKANKLVKDYINKAILVLKVNILVEAIALIKKVILQVFNILKQVEVHNFVVTTTMVLFVGDINNLMLVVEANTNNLEVMDKLLVEANIIKL